MRNAFAEAMLLALFAGAGGTALGVSGALFIRQVKKRLSCVLLGLAGGLMLAIAVLDMIPEAWESGGGAATVIGLAAGGVVLYLISKRSRHADLHEADGVNPEEVKHRSLLRTGVLLAAGVSIHNMPQGLAIGSSIQGGFAWSLSVLLLIHNIPEGMAMALPLRVGHVKARRIYAVALLTTIPTIIGALIGTAVAEISGLFIAGSLSFASGAMILLTILELIPQAAELGTRRTLAAATAAGAAVGAIFVWVLE